jgi:hypothetical protein
VGLAARAIHELAQGRETRDARVGAALMATAILDIHALVTGLGKATASKKRHGRR